MKSELVRFAILAVLAAAFGALAMLPRQAHGESAGEDAHDVPPFARSRTDIVQHAPPEAAP